LFVLFVVVAKFANLFFSSGHMFEFFLQLVTLEEKQSFSGAFFPRATTGEGEGQRQIFFERRGESERERERAWGSSFHMLELLSLEITLLQGFEV
jgi:hypothetical protein